MADVLFFFETKLENPVKAFFEPLKNVAMSKTCMAPFFNRPRLQNLETSYIQWDVFVWRPAVFNVLSMLKVGTDAWNELVLVTWIYGKFVAWNTPPSKNSAKLTLAPGSWLPKRTGYAWAGLIAESSWATRLAVPKLKLTGWCHGTGVLKIIHIEGRSRPPQGKGVSKRKSVRRVKNDYEVFSDRKIMVVFSGKAGGNWGGLFWSLTPHERHCFGLPDSDRKKTAAASTKKWFPCEVFFPQQISAVSKVRNEKCY